MINFKDILAVNLTKFNNGEGTLNAKIFNDNKVRIMRVVVPSGASVGKHTHIDTCEVIYVLSGKASCNLNGNEEQVKTGEVHYCPQGSTHFIINNEQQDLVLFCVVPKTIS